MKSFAPGAVVVVGFLLLVMSVAWALLFPPGQGWTEEKSARMNELADQAGAMRLQIHSGKTKPSMHSGENPAELQEKYNKLDVEYKTLYEEFLSARDSPAEASRFLRWSGIAFVVAGALVVFATRSG